MWSGGSGQYPYDTWEKAATTLQQAANAVASEGDQVHLAKEQFATTGWFTTLQPFSQEWIGGYDLFSLGTDYSNTPFDGLTPIECNTYCAFKLHVLDGPGKTLILRRLKIDKVSPAYWIFEQVSTGGAPKIIVENCVCYSSTSGAGLVHIGNGVTNGSHTYFDFINSVAYNLTKLGNRSVKNFTARNSIFHNIASINLAGTPVCSYSDFYETGFEIPSGTGNFTTDPCFADLAGYDFTLQLGSPCIDAGDPMYPYGREPLPNGNRVNTGAYGNTEKAARSIVYIIAAAGPGGQISPAGSVMVELGHDQVFSLAPDDDYKIAELQVDGVPVAVDTVYTFTNVRQHHTIQAIFAPCPPIESFALFALNSMVVGPGSDILSGNIGVNLRGTAEYDLVMDTGATTPAGYNTFADKIDIHAYVALEGSLSYASPESRIDPTASLNGVVTTDYPFPIRHRLPPFLSETPGDSDVTIYPGESKTITPGTYGTLDLRNGDTTVYTTLQFGPGKYVFDKIDIGKCGVLHFTGHTVIVSRSIKMKKDSYAGPKPSSSITAADIIFYINNGADTLAMAKDNAFKANIYAPTASIWIADNTEMTGAVIAKNICLGAGVQFTGDSYFGKTHPAVKAAPQPEKRMVMSPPIEVRSVIARPNPMTSRITISFTVDQKAGQIPVTVGLYSMSGGHLMDLYHGYRSLGRYNVVWDGTSRQGSKLSNGVYIYRITSGEVCLQGAITLSR